MKSQRLLLVSPGPVHQPMFTVSVEVNGRKFQGSASSKKKAKLNAAESALGSYVQLPNTSGGTQPTSVSMGGQSIIILLRLILYSDQLVQLSCKKLNLL